MGLWASIPLRLGLGLMFAAHGMQKVFGWFGGSGIKAFAEQLSSLNFVSPVFWAYVAAYTELIGGICLIIGLGTRIGSGLLLVLIVVAGASVHLKNGFFLINGGIEYVFIIACACIALILLGGGKFSITNKF